MCIWNSKFYQFLKCLFCCFNILGHGGAQELCPSNHYSCLVVTQLACSLQRLICLKLIWACYIQHCKTSLIQFHGCNTTKLDKQITCVNQTVSFSMYKILLTTTKCTSFHTLQKLTKQVVNLHIIFKKW